MDGFEYLAADHREVERLFDEFERTGDPDVAREICFVLTLHAEAEETVLYPALRSLVAGGSDIARRAAYEHATVKEFVARAYDASPVELADVMRAMRAAVTSHVAEEEGEIFPQLREDGLDARRLRVDLEHAKEDARRRALQPAS